MQPESIQPNSADLTVQSDPSTLDVRGNIFMAEGKGEQSPRQPESKPTPKPEQPIIPLDQQGTDILKGEYVSLVGFLDRLKPGRDREGYESDLRPRITHISEELARRGIDIGQLPKEEVPSMHGVGTPAATNQEYLGRLGNLRDQITNPEFRAVIEQIINNPDTIPMHYEALVDRHKELYADLLGQIGKVSVETAGVVEMATLNAELARLETEFNLVRRNIITEIPHPERGVDEGDRAELDKIKDIPDGADRNNAIRNFMKRYVQKVSPEDEAISDEIMRLIAEDNVATEEFVSRLIVSYIENEPWSIKGFYGNINFEKFTRVTRNIITGERRDHLLTLIDANSALHTMNFILKRNFEQFSQQSEAILPQHLSNVSKLPGVDDALTLYEEMTAEVLGEETMITEELAQSITDRVEKEIAERAHRIRGLAGGSLEDWEVNRALIYARNFFRISVRFAEQTALSELARDDDPSLYVSSPQKQLVQVLNTLKIVGLRFHIEETLGGPEMLSNSIKYTTKSRKEDREVRLKTLQGTSVDMREFQGIVGARGVFATWRNAEIALRQLVFEDESGRVTNAVQFFLDHNAQLAVLNERSKNKNLSSTQRQELKDDVKTLFRPLLDQTSIHLGLLASSSGLSYVTPEFKELIWEKIIDLNPAFVASLLTRLETDDERLQFIQNGEIGLKIEALEDILLKIWGTDEQKKAIWGESNLRWSETSDLLKIKMEDFGTLGMREIKRLLAAKSDQLHTQTATKDSNRSASQRTRIEQLSIEVDALRSLYGDKDNVLKELFHDNRWQGLLKKLRIANKMRVNEEADRIKDRERINEAPKTLEDFLTSANGLELSAEETQAIASITISGKEISRDLANINQSTSWFLDDVSFKNLDWIRLGQFYDRETGDLANFNRSAAALLKILSNPFGMPMDDVLKDFQEAINGASSVIGRKAAQDNQFPMLVSWVDMIYEKPIFRQLFVEMAMHTFKKPTSRAQEIVGMEGLAVNEDGMQAVFDKCLPLGVLRREVKDERGKVKWDSTYDKIRKKFKTGWQNIAWGKFRDYGPIGLVAFLIQFFQSLSKEKLN